MPTYLVRRIETRITETLYEVPADNPDEAENMVKDNDPRAFRRSKVTGPLGRDDITLEIVERIDKGK